MKPGPTLAIALLVLLGSTQGAQAVPDDDRLEIGDLAPALDITHWLIGDEVDTFQEGHIYVVELWATWCGPCVANMPHLSDLQDRYGEQGVTIIGFSNEPLQTAVAFLVANDREGVRMRDRIRFTLGTDPDQSAWNDYLIAAGYNGIPRSYVVGRDGRIEWMGHPKRGLDDVLQAVVDDVWDRAGAKDREARQQEGRRESNEAIAAIRDSLEREDWEAAVIAYDQLTSMSDQFYGYVVPPFEILLHKIGDRERAYRYARGQVKRFWDNNERVLYQFAWKITEAPSELRELELAFEVITQANEMTEWSASDMLSMYAMVQAQRGEFADAVEYERKALQIEESHRSRLREDQLKGFEEFLDMFRARLKEYETMLDEQAKETDR